MIVAEEHLLLLLCKLKYACKDSKEKCHCLLFDVNKETLQNDKSTQKLKSTMLLQHCMRAVQFIMLTHDYVMALLFLLFMVLLYYIHDVHKPPQGNIMGARTWLKVVVLQAQNVQRIIQKLRIHKVRLHLELMLMNHCKHSCKCLRT